MSLDRVTAVCVLHDSAAVIGEMLESLPEDLALIVVDNRSTDNGAAIVAEKRPSARIIASAENGGYGRGMNQALAAVETPFCVVTSPDVVFGEGAIEAMLAAAGRYPEAALIGPRIHNPDGSIEISHDARLEDRRRLGRRDGEPAPEGPVCAEFLSGATWFARMDAIDALGGFDPAIFLFYEDDDLCRRLRDAGYSLIVEPAAAVAHVGGASVPSTERYSWLKHWHMGWSRLYFERKHRGRTGMWHVFLREAPVYVLKSAGYALTRNHGKSRRDFARFRGMLAAVAGKPSQCVLPAGPDKAA